jgi:hypothetical protein
MSELNGYQEIIVKLGLLENDDADRIFKHCLKLYPECSEKDMERMLGMLSLVLDDLDYDDMVCKVFPTRKPSIIKSLPSWSRRLFSFVKEKVLKNESN